MPEEPKDKITYRNIRRKTHIFAVVPHGIKRKIQQQAEESGMTMSAVVRNILQDKFK